MNQTEPMIALGKQIDALRRHYKGMAENVKRGNIKQAALNREKSEALIATLKDEWQAILPDLEHVETSMREVLMHDDYIVALEAALADLEVPVSGEFPSYTLPPFTFNVNRENLEARLTLGRKNERTGDLDPTVLAAWVAVRYKKMQARRFKAEAFMKDLYAGYQMGLWQHFPQEMQRALAKKETLSGLAVPMTTIYQLLTLKRTARSDYPLPFFVYDLGLFKESGIFSDGKHRFELGFARRQEKALLIVDSQGRESHISSLTVYEEQDA